MTALAAIVRVGLQIRTGPVALGLRVWASTSQAAARHVLAARASGAGIAARAAVVDVQRGVHAVPATAPQTADGVVGPAPVVLAGGGAPVGDGAACRAVRTAHLAGAAITVVPTGAPALSADPALTTVGTVPVHLFDAGGFDVPVGFGAASPPRPPPPVTSAAGPASSLAHADWGLHRPLQQVPLRHSASLRQR